MRVLIATGPWTPQRASHRHAQSPGSHDLDCAPSGLLVSVEQARRFSRATSGGSLPAPLTTTGTSSGSAAPRPSPDNPGSPRVAMCRSDLRLTRVAGRCPLPSRPGAVASATIRASPRHSSAAPLGSNENLSLHVRTSLRAHLRTSYPDSDPPLRGLRNTAYTPAVEAARGLSIHRVRGKPEEID